jgi:hypothetical protein
MPEVEALWQAAYRDQARILRRGLQLVVTRSVPSCHLAAQMRRRA